MFQKKTLKITLTTIIALLVISLAYAGSYHYKEKLVKNSAELEIYFVEIKNLGKDDLILYYYDEENGWWVEETR